jgi:flagellar motor protein MotB
MSGPDHFPRIGGSQGAIIFWGLVSAVFATAAIHYKLKDDQDAGTADKFRDQALALQDERESLSSEKDKLQAGLSEEEKDVKTREEFLQEKENKLAAEEERLDAAGNRSPNQPGDAAVVKKFDETVRKVAKDGDTDVVLRAGRPVLRIPSSVFFAPGETTLKADGKAILTQVAAAIAPLDSSELRIECFSDASEAAKAATDTAPDAAAKPDGAASPDASTKPAKPKAPTSLDLTGARATAIARFLRDQTALPFGNIIAVGRGDFAPVVPAGKEGHARNRRIEITIAPLPAPLHASDLAASAPAPASTNAASSAPPVDPLEPPPDPPAK